MSNAIRVMLVDDNPRFRAVLRRLIEREGDMTVLAEAENGLEAIGLAAEHRPDVIVMDVSMSEMDGITATNRITSEQPGLKVVLLSIGNKAQEVAAGLAGGASEYLIKGASAQRIIAAIRRNAPGVQPPAPPAVPDPAARP